jgi:cellulose synthase/poly-beta-1,6-N-acetylglucosamine synthase-like glycosyltransferase
MELFDGSLRPLAVLVGAAALFWGARHIRSFGSAQTKHFLATLLGAGLIFVGLFATFFRQIAGLFGLAEAQNGAIILLLLLSVSVLIVVVVVLLDRGERSKRSLDKLNREISFAEFRRSAEASKIPEPADRQVLCIVPAYNEGANLAHVLDGFRDLDSDLSITVLVVDDGSGDDTASVVAASSAVYFRHYVNRGQGSALRSGYRFAVDYGFQYAVTLDADGQNQPSEVELLVAPLRAGTADVVIGSRILGEHEITVPWRHWGVLFFTRLFNFLTGQKVTDIASGFKAATTGMLQKMQLYEDQFQSSEFLMVAAKSGARLHEVPIRFTRRHSGKSKKGNEFLYALRFARVLTTSWLRYRR